MILQSYVFENECNAIFRPIGSRDKGKVGNILCIDEFSSILCVSQSVAGYVGTPELLRVMVTNTGDGCTNGEMVRVQMATEISSDRSELYYNDPLYGNDQWVPQRCLRGLHLLDCKNNSATTYTEPRPVRLPPLPPQNDDPSKYPRLQVCPAIASSEHMSSSSWPPTEVPSSRSPSVAPTFDSSPHFPSIGGAANGVPSFVPTDPARDEPTNVLLGDEPTSTGSWLGLNVWWYLELFGTTVMLVLQ